MTGRIERSIALRAPIDRVWRALTDQVEFGQWFRVDIEAPFRLDQKARGQITHPGFEHVVWEVTVVEMREPSLFAFTWHPYAVEPGVDYSKEAPTRVEFRLEAKGDETHLVVVESGFDQIPAHRRDEALRMNDGGWAAQMENIKAHVDS